MSSGIIVRNLKTLLKNGNTPDGQTILGVLEDIGEKYGSGFWRLRKDGQRELTM